MSNEKKSFHEDDEDNSKMSSEACNSSQSSSDNSDDKHEAVFDNIQPTEGCTSNGRDSCENGRNLENPHANLEKESMNIDSMNKYIYDIIDGLDERSENTLSDDEIEKKFQDLSFAFRTDSMTLTKRLVIRKRLRDLAEVNIEREINLMKSKLNNLKYVCTDFDSLQQLTDLWKHLDVILATANYLSGTAEAYGFVQNEDKMSDAVSLVLKQMECMERIQSEISKSSDIDKQEEKRIQLMPVFNEDGSEEQTLRRRSVASVSLNGSARRRASIASVPRNFVPLDEINGICASSIHGGPSNRGTGLASKISSNQPNIGKQTSSLVAEHIYPHDKFYRSRSGKDIRCSEIKLKYMHDIADHQSIVDDDDDLFLDDGEEDLVEEMNKSQLTVLRLPSPFQKRARKNSAISETLNIIDAFRNVVKWNILVMRNSRFQFPENVHQYVPFIITWYLVVLTAAIFACGFVTGISGCQNQRDD